MIEQKPVKEMNSLSYYISLARSGQYPLFFKEWLTKYPILSNTKSFSKKKRKLESYFNEIDKHRNIDRKKIAISAMEEGEREIFLQMFFGKLEDEILNDYYKYH